jgi:Domain of unknown function (DUF305)
MSYLRFGAMIATSTVVMFVLMYLNTYAWEHVFWSETRVYMAILMGACMAVIMLGYMLSMYENTIANVAIFAGSALVFALALWLVRSQATVGEVSYMRAMIPHHSIAIMTSERAQITDPRVRKLADEIIAAQRREIAEMRYLVATLEGDDGPPPPDVLDEPQPEAVPPSEAISATVIATLDPEDLAGAEVETVLPAGPGCRFHRTAESGPILAVRLPGGDAGAEGVMKLNGKLVALRSDPAATAEALLAGPTMVADGIRMTVSPVPDTEPETQDGGSRIEADLVFELEQGLTVGYRGFYYCDI